MNGLLVDIIPSTRLPPPPLPRGSAPLVEQAKPMSACIAALKRRAVAADVPVIYVNDNFGRWRSDFRNTVKHCTALSSPGRVVSRRLRPGSRDYFVLKPKHSGFFDTTLDTLLEALGTRRLILTGLAGNICVLFTANDAYMREYKLYMPSDCVASNAPSDNEYAPRQIATVLKGNVAESTRLTFRRGSSATAQRAARAVTRPKPGVMG